MNTKGDILMRLIIENVGKRYKGDFWGLRQFHLDLGPGILGLLGPNGAGKSTLMRILATITRASEGRVLWDSIDIARRPHVLRSVLGYLPQDFGIYPHLSAQEFLEYMAAIKGLDGRAARRRIQELLENLNLTEARKRPLGSYSRGMRQRVGIAQALLNDPRLLIVDEPTVGLDPEERVRFRNLLTDLSGERIVILSTHIVSDVEATASTIAIVNNGRLLAHATPEQLIARVEGRVWELVTTDVLDVRERFAVSGMWRRSDGIHVRVLSELPPMRDARPLAPSLEDAYLYAVRFSRFGG
uniref:ABC transporter ATP-binding protein n=1 Tax=Thermosporothrix sp. COM3 TaxID=2490863 RepID=A0A455SN80_9CHLR|nr:ABC transporter ATP-binding protein [Thermosporothrix sp. COM3]